jgi:hypothetical protein
VSSQVVASGGMPYSEVPIEYPPGVLPFVLVPAWLQHHLRIPFPPSFILLMIAVDGLGLTGLRRLGRRWGSDLGAWLWVVALPLLGPIVLLRLDLVPAVATIWCLERAAAGRWTAAGAFLGFGCLAKLYPLFLLPAAIVIARNGDASYGERWWSASWGRPPGRFDQGHGGTRRGVPCRPRHPGRELVG